MVIPDLGTAPGDPTGASLVSALAGEVGERTAILVFIPRGFLIVARSVRSSRVARVVLALLALSFFVGAAAPAAAETGPTPVIRQVLDSPDPKAAYAGLSVGDRAVFDRHMLPAVRETKTTFYSVNAPSIGAPAGINGCWRGWANASDRALAGNTLYTFHTVWDWCASGSAVTWVGRVDVWAETSTPGWRIDYQRWRQSGVVYQEGRAVGEFLFILGSGGWDIVHAYRCLRGGGRWNGTVWADRGCSIY